MKPSFNILLPALAATAVLGACSSGSTSDVTPTQTTKVTTTSPTSPGGGSGGGSSVTLPSLGEDAQLIRETASDALANKDTGGTRASVEDAINKNIPDGSDGGPDKRTELIDKATDAARDKAKELGKEEDLDKVRSALDSYLKKDGS